MPLSYELEGARLRRRLCSLIGSALCAIVALAPTSVQARKNGITAEGCTGCHGSEKAVTVSATVSPAVFEPGDVVTIDVSVSASNIKAAGMFLKIEDALGTLTTLPGEGLVLAGGGLTHATPKAAAGGTSHFRFSWRAPDTAGAARFNVYAVAANGDGSRSGDSAGQGLLDVVYGCEAQPYYSDGDGDGFGRDEPPTLRCAGQTPANYATSNTDCDDYRVESYPAAIELCNGRDDDCDGMIDEGAVPIPLYPDKDGDGYYKDGAGPSIMGCIPKAGFAADWGDCDETKASVHRGAEEVCNQLDDDCDGRADEGGVRPQCGEGWCRRESATCSADACVPGDPAPETCNGVDDDCDGDVDEAVSCGAGLSCIGGTCQSEAEIMSGEGGDGGTPGEPLDRDIDAIEGKGKRPKAAKSCSMIAPSDERGAWLAMAYGVALFALARRRLLLAS